MGKQSMSGTKLPVYKIISAAEDFFKAYEKKTQDILLKCAEKEYKGQFAKSWLGKMFNLEILPVEHFSELLKKETDCASGNEYLWMYLSKVHLQYIRIEKIYNLAKRFQFLTKCSLQRMILTT